MKEPDAADPMRTPSDAPSDVDLERVWAGIASEAWATSPGRFERLARAALGSPGMARALVITPSLYVAWILASAAVLAIGVLLTYGTDTPWVALFAPALAGVGIAYAYGPGVDPAYEIVESVPVSHRMILLVRILAVFSVNAVLGAIASLITPAAAELTLGWFAPMTTVSAIALTSATIARSANAGVAIAMISWAAMIVISAGSRPGNFDLSIAVSNARLIPIYLALTAVIALLALYAGYRRDRSAIWQQV